MGDNEVRLVEIYLELKKQLAQAQISGNSHVEDIIGAKMDGIVIGYETYASAHWLTMDALVERYKAYSRDEWE